MTDCELKSCCNHSVGGYLLIMCFNDVYVDLMEYTSFNLVLFKHSRHLQRRFITITYGYCIICDLCRLNALIKANTCLNAAHGHWLTADQPSPASHVCYVSVVAHCQQSVTHQYCHRRMLLSVFHWKVACKSE